MNDFDAGDRAQLAQLLFEGVSLPDAAGREAMFAHTFAAGSGGADLLPPDGLFDVPDDGTDAYDGFVLDPADLDHADLDHADLDHADLDQADLDDGLDDPDRGDAEPAGGGLDDPGETPADDWAGPGDPGTGTGLDGAGSGW